MQRAIAAKYCPSIRCDNAEEKINFNSHDDKKGSVIHDDKLVAAFENAYDRLAVKRRASLTLRPLGIVSMPDISSDNKSLEYSGVNADISVVSA